MSDDLRDKEKRLEGLKVENEIEEQKKQISEKKALEAEARKKYGKDWRHILGLVGKNIRVNQDAVQTLYSSGFGDLRSRSEIRVRRK